MENAENLRDFFKVALFFPAGKDPWRTRKIFGIFSKLHFFPGGKGSVGENLRDFFKVALFFHAGKDPWRMGGKLRDFSKLHFFSRRERIRENRQENPRDFFKVALFFPAGKDPLRSVLYVPAKSPRM